MNPSTNCTMCKQEINISACVREENVDDQSEPVPPPLGEFHEFVMKVRRKARNVPVVLLAMVLTSYFHAGHCVWSFNVPHQAYILGAQTFWCSTFHDLTREQLKLCQMYPEEIASLGLGAKIAIKECKFQFQYRLWNCSIPEDDKGGLFERIRKQGTREAAFTYAMSSAGVVWALARACAEGNLSNCPCSTEKRPSELKREFQWGGCGDNIERGVEFSKQFINSGENWKGMHRNIETLTRTLMNLHNNDVGREVTKQTSIIECKCHGVSGSCNLKTCWRELSEFREIGNRLHDKYDAAIHVEVRSSDAKQQLLPVPRRQSYSKRKAQPVHGKTDLVYTAKSPNYCNRNLKVGSPGTHGRKCNKDSHGTDSCNILCCGRSYVSKVVRVNKRCRCKFYWCCHVRCKVCSKNVTIHTCK